MGVHSSPLTFTLVPGMAPAAPLMRLLARFDRPKVEAFAEISIALLDFIDGDPDAEEDDPTGQCDEDGINTNLYEQWGRGPGCAISDNDCEHDGREPEQY
jgi:hypothetical protein